jgi:hypothetical protein
MVAFAIVAMSGLSLSLAVLARAATKEQRQDKESVHARYVCEAGLSNSMFALQRGASGALGTQAAPLAWDTSNYWVTQNNIAADLIKLTATGLDERSAARMELVVRQVPNTIWRFGAFGKEYLHMDSNARVDSYNSDSGTYASQDVNDTGSNQHANTNGDVGSNGSISMDQNSKVWGDAMAGPDHSTTVLGNAFVTGSTVSSAQLVDLPALNVPTYTNLGTLTVSGTTTIPTGTRTYSNVTINSNKTLNITGPAEIVMTNLTLRSGATINIDDTNGPVTLWVIDSFIMNSNSLLAPLDHKSKNLRVNLLSDNVINPEVSITLDTVDFNSNTQLYGTVYAPNAHIQINSNFQLFGSLVSRSVDLNSNASFHFDEALLSATASGAPTFETVSWRRVPYVHP